MRLVRKIAIVDCISNNENWISNRRDAHGAPAQRQESAMHTDRVVSLVCV